MEDIFIEATPKTPNIFFDASLGKFEIKGRSIPENPSLFYAPFKKWIKEYITSPLDVTIVDLKLEYFNNKSSKCILEMLKLLENINKDGSFVRINWYFDEEDEDMLETGEDFNALLKIPFTMVKVKSVQV
ncbi:MAG: DUF1987 domain-containing protein [Brumimicrobium sp.]